MPRFTSDESKIVLAFVIADPKIISFFDPSDGSMLSAYSIHGNSFNYEANFKYLGDINGYMYFDAMKSADSYFKNIIKISYPTPTNETLK